MERLVGVIRRSRQRRWLLANQALQMLDGGIELCVLAQGGCVRQVVHDNIRIHAVTFDEPGLLRAVNPDFSGTGDSAVCQEIAEAQPNLAAPGARPDYFTETQAAKPFRKRLAIGAGPFVAQHHDMTAKRLLHIPKRLAYARLP